MISVIITMTLIWLLLCFASVVTLKQYAQKNLELTGATMSHSLEASLVFNDSLAANETLAALGKQGQFAVAEVINAHKKRFAYWSWNPTTTTRWVRWSAAGFSPYRLRSPSCITVQRSAKFALPLATV
ncbi:hypothetical protein TUM17577_28650 [Enterobacter asburiae]|nr:hypothetical protein TUM17577_28650 [Enterobacter asburiae]